MAHVRADHEQARRDQERAKQLANNKIISVIQEQLVGLVQEIGRGRDPRPTEASPQGRIGTTVDCCSKGNTLKWMK